VSVQSADLRRSKREREGCPEFRLADTEARRPHRRLGLGVSPGPRASFCSRLMRIAQRPRPRRIQDQRSPTCRFARNTDASFSLVRLSGRNSLYFCTLLDFQRGARVHVRSSIASGPAPRARSIDGFPPKDAGDHRGDCCRGRSRREFVRDRRPDGDGREATARSGRGRPAARAGIAHQAAPRRADRQAPDFARDLQARPADGEHRRQSADHRRGGPDLPHTGRRSPQAPL
jgi:hypothetical protein